MSCEEVKKSIGMLRDNAASARVKNQLENHVADCASCRAALDRLQALGSLLQKDIMPLPSPALDRRVMQAFCAKHERPAASTAWWKTVFAGSISVPKPIFAAALIIIALTVGWANLIEKNGAMFAHVNTALNTPHVTSPPQAIEKTNFVEVPIIRERVITKTVYVESQSGKAQKTTKKSSVFSRNKSNVLGNKSKTSANQDVPGLQMSASIAANGYFTRADLRDFEPARESNIRIIRKEKADEK